MAFEIPPNGTRGTKPQSSGMLRRGSAFMAGFYRLTGGRVGPTLLLTTVGAKSGDQRVASVRRFDEGDGQWLVVGSAAGSARHPSWIYNAAAHPDQVWAEIGR